MRDEYRGEKVVREKHNCDIHMRLKRLQYNTFYDKPR